MERNGTVLGGRYHLQEKIGTGGMSDVYAAVDDLLGRDVAIKMMRPDLARDKNFLERFRREAQNAAKLNHPAIVAVYDTGQTPDNAGEVPYIVMERVHGETLREIVLQQGKMKLNDAASVMAQVLDALHFSHEAGIIHRDIKPANIMITNTGAVKVMDFGIARALSDSSAAMTQTAAVIGTAQYLSPEQARGQSADARSDVYAAGCVFYELTTGRPPFSGESPFSVAFQHVQDTPSPPSTIPGMHLSHREAYSLDAIVITAMAKNPDDRYEDSAEMAADLRRITEDQLPLVAHIPDGMGSGDYGNLGPQHGGGMDGTAGTDAAGAGAGAVGAAGVAGAAGAGAADAAAEAHTMQQDSHPPHLLDNSEWENTAHSDAVDHGDHYENYDGYDNYPGYNNYDNYDEYDDYEEEPRRRKWIPIIAIVALLALVGGGTWAYVKSDRMNGSSSVSQDVRIPSVEDLNQDEAEAKLQDLGLEIRVTERPHAEIPRGHAIRTEPAANSSVPAGTQVTLVISNGKEITEVPDLTGKNTSQAANVLKEAGLALNQEVKEDTSDDVPAGEIISQTPVQGSQVSKGTKVTITVSTGPGDVRVPTVAGQSVEDATGNLEGAGFKVNIINVDSLEPEGQVVSADGEGSYITRGSTVDVSVSKGNQIRMPDLTGKKYSSTISILRAAGWEGNPAEITRHKVPTPDISKVDLIATQSVPSGEAADKRSSVDIGVYEFQLLP